jgi:phasin family protein
MSGDTNNPLADLLAEQKKNIEALARANQIAISGLQAVATRQMEFVQRAMADASQVASHAGQSQGVNDLMARQTDVAKQAFDQSIANMRELADMLQKSGREAVDVVNQRIAQSLAELKDRVGPAKGPKS